MINIRDISTTAGAWKLLAVSAFAFECCALYFQYIMALEPCIMCIYQRVAIFSILFAGLLGSIGHNYAILRLLAFALWGVGAIWGLIIALEHVEIQSATLSFLYSCDIIPNFPSWAPLHEWLPNLFAATGDCGDINWQFLGFTMPQVMIVIFAVYTALLAVVLLSRIILAKKI